MESLISRVQVLDKDSSGADKGHKIGVAVPARDDVEVVMVNDARARALTKVHPGIEPVGVVAPAQDFQAEFKEVHQFIARLLRGAVKVGDVSDGGDHQMAWRIRKLIQEDEIVLAAEEDVGCFVLFQPKGTAEDTTFHPENLLDISFSPWGRNIFHQLFLLTSSLSSLLGLK